MPQCYGCLVGLIVFGQTCLILDNVQCYGCLIVRTVYSVTDASSNSADSVQCIVLRMPHPAARTVFDKHASSWTVYNVTDASSLDKHASSGCPDSVRTNMPHLDSVQCLIWTVYNVTVYNVTDASSCGQCSDKHASSRTMYIVDKVQCYRVPTDMPHPGHCTCFILETKKYYGEQITGTHTCLTRDNVLIMLRYASSHKVVLWQTTLNPHQYATYP